MAEYPAICRQQHRLSLAVCYERSTRAVRSCGLGLALLLLAACGAEESLDSETDTVDDRDPATLAALGDEIMIDPDLANQNEANAALTAGASASLPPETAGTEAARAAKDLAADMVGGTDRLVSPPEPQEIETTIPSAAKLTVRSRAVMVEGADDCAKQATYSAVWAARLPEELPIYPQGATHEAAGTDRDNCNLRAVHFLTPVEVEDVLAFYNSRAKSAGYSVEHLRRDDENILSGGKGTARYAIYTRKADAGMTSVDLITLDRGLE